MGACTEGKKNTRPNAWLLLLCLPLLLTPPVSCLTPHVPAVVKSGEAVKKIIRHPDRTFREKFDDTIETYVPDGLRDIGSAFTEGLTAPFTAIKELGTGFMSMLKPLKLLPKLLKGFTVGLLGALAAMIPYLLIAAAIVIGLIALKKAFDFLKENIDTVKEKLSNLVE